MGQPFQQVVPQQEPNLEVLPAEYQPQQPSTQITINPVAPAPVHAVASVENVANKVEYPVLNEKAWDFCQKISKSTLIPESIRSTETADHTADVYMIMALGNSLGLNFMQSLSGIYTVPGTARPALYTNTKRALVLKAGGLIDERWDEQSNAAIVTITRGSQKYTRTFGVQEAISMGKMFIDPNDGIAKGVRSRSGNASPWAIDYKNMCMLRALSRCCDAAYADVLMGLSSVEELNDYATYTENEPTTTKEPTAKLTPASEVNPALASAIKPKATRKRKEVEIQQEPTVEVEAQVEPLPF